MTLAEKIRETRKRLGLTQSELARRVGVESFQVSRWERGIAKSARPEHIKKLADLAGADMEYFTDTETPHLLTPATDKQVFSELMRVYRKTGGRGPRWAAILEAIRRADQAGGEPESKGR